MMEAILDGVPDAAGAGVESGALFPLETPCLRPEENTYEDFDGSAGQIQAALGGEKNADDRFDGVSAVDGRPRRGIAIRCPAKRGGVPPRPSPFEKATGSSSPEKVANATRAALTGESSGAAESTPGNPSNDAG